jgi:hypothetical protein
MILGHRSIQQANSAGGLQELAGVSRSLPEVGGPTHVTARPSEVQIALYLVNVHLNFH